MVPVCQLNEFKKVHFHHTVQYNQNIEQRAKYSNQPSKFLESEIELDEAVRSLTVVATSPELYPELVHAGAAAILISLLNHENGDIVADTIDTLSELTDADAVEDSVRCIIQPPK